jgi:hypothetical protein
MKKQFFLVLLLSTGLYAADNLKIQESSMELDFVVIPIPQEMVDKAAQKEKAIKALLEAKNNIEVSGNRSGGFKFTISDCDEFTVVSHEQEKEIDLEKGMKKDIGDQIDDEIGNIANAVVDAVEGALDSLDSVIDAGANKFESFVNWLIEEDDES